MARASPQNASGLHLRLLYTQLRPTPEPVLACLYRHTTGPEWGVDLIYIRRAYSTTHTAPRIHEHIDLGTASTCVHRPSVSHVPIIYAHPSIRTDTRLSARRLARRVHVSSLSLRTDTRLSARRLARRVHVSSLSLSHPPPSLSLSRKPTPVTAPDGRPSPRPGGMVGRTYVYVLVSCRRLSP